MTQREVERRVAQSAATLEAKREEIANVEQTDTMAKFREAAELADRNYRLGAVPLTIYVETQKQYLEAIGRCSDDQEGRAASGARAGDSDRVKALQRGGATMIDKILEFAVRQRVLVLMGALALLLLVFGRQTNCRWMRSPTSRECRCR